MTHMGTLSFFCLSFLLVFRVLSVSALTLGFKYGSTKVRGVNLGGWLPWITPSIFDNTNDTRVIDEYTFGKYVPQATAKSVLATHWNTWITESDLIAIASAGLNHVRLPIGYWAFDVSAGEPYHQGQVAYLTKAVAWAKTHKLKLIIDLHGVPGSQNGFDNSGQRLPQPLWQTKSSYIARSNAIIKKLALQYANQTDVVTVIAPLNEPAGFRGPSVLNAVTQYWYDSYGNVRYPYGTSKQGNALVLIHDAFQPLSYWNKFMAYPQYEGVALDTHVYQMFSDEVGSSNQQHIQSACARATSLASFKTLWVIVGEWTPAVTDCAKYLNGRGIGARYDGTYPGSTFVGSCNSSVTGSRANFSKNYTTFLRQMWEAQVISFEKGGAGWVQWTWRTEVADEWSYKAGLAGGWIPQVPTQRKYPNICT